MIKIFIVKNTCIFVIFKLSYKYKDRKKLNNVSTLGYIIKSFTSLVSVLKMPSYFAWSVSIECHNVQKEFHYFSILPVIVATIALYRYNVFNATISSLSQSLSLSLSLYVELLLGIKKLLIIMGIQPCTIMKSLSIQ